MGDITGIAWTDSTLNFWEGCTKVGPGCDHCYAENRDIRFHGGAHWGTGAARRQMSPHTRYALRRYQRDAAKFLAEHGHPRRVFCSSLSDIFDNEVESEWRLEAFAEMEAAPDVRIQICTKRVSNVIKMIPEHWGKGDTGILKGHSFWPQNVGLLITVVTPEEIARDVPRLAILKRQFGIPWVGLSIEPMIADIADAFAAALSVGDIDWVILGGESGIEARPCDLSWIASALVICNWFRVSAFVKQMGDRPLLRGKPIKMKAPAGGNPEEWPKMLELGIRQFPAALS